MAGARIDHLIVYGDVDAVTRRVAEATGVEPTDGGVHPGEGTRNAIFAARDQRSFEILGRDPEQDAEPHWAPDHPDGDGVLWWWAVRTDEEPRDLAARLGAGMTEPEPGERLRPSGGRVAWETVDLVDHPFGTTLPFLIRWTDGTPPWALAGDAELAIEGFRAWHPDADGLAAAFSALGLVVPVAEASTPRLEAALRGPRGDVRFASA
jgi:hypothetical protein